MKIPAQTRTQTLGLIDEGSSVDPSDLEVLHRWMQATYETLHFNSVQQQRFDEYCRSSCAFTSSMTRPRCGGSMLKQALCKDAPPGIHGIPQGKMTSSPEAESKTVKDSQKQTGDVTILLVEDDDLVRDVTKRMMERSGYSVLTTANGIEALNLYVEEKDGISLVILDLIMPEMGGKQCLEKLREIDPNVKILVTSGYCVDGVVKEVTESGARGFVCKPYNSEQMLTAVREALDSQ